MFKNRISQFLTRLTQPHAGPLPPRSMPIVVKYHPPCKANKKKGK